MELKHIVQEFYDRFGEGDIDGATALFSEAVKMSDPGLGTVEGSAALRDYLEGLKVPVPDARATVDRMHVVGDTVIVEGRFIGVNSGPLPGPDGPLPPSGRAVELPFADFSRVRDGRIVEYRTYYDQLGLLTQLGLMD